LERFGDDEFKEELKRFGYEHNPGLVRLMARIGQAMANDNFVGGSGGNAQPEPSIAEKLYGGTKA
jgi:hypothetical protein